MQTTFVGIIAVFCNKILRLNIFCKIAVFVAATFCRSDFLSPSCIHSCLNVACATVHRLADMHYSYNVTLLLTCSLECILDCILVSRKFSVSAHVTELLTNCARTLFAIRTLKQHGLPPEAVHTVFQATVMAKINYASPAWWGFTSADDHGRLEAILPPLRPIRLLQQRYYHCQHV